MGLFSERTCSDVCEWPQVKRQEDTNGTVTLTQHCGSHKGCRYQLTNIWSHEQVLKQLKTQPLSTFPKRKHQQKMVRLDTDVKQQANVLHMNAMNKKHKTTKNK